MKRIWLLAASFGLCILIVVIDRFIISVPRWLMVGCDGLSVVLLAIFIGKKRYARAGKKDKE